MKLALSRRIRPTPFEPRVLEHNPDAFSIYNKMTLPAVFDSLTSDYHHLCEHVQLWDVGCERQVEIEGPDALALVELITPRDISSCSVGQCMYAPLVDEDGGIINDPIVLRLASDKFWLSIADSDVLLWVKGIAFGKSLDVNICEPDVSPLAVQGPKAEDLMADMLGEHVREIGFFKFIEVTLANTKMLMARSGWSGQGGFEIYLPDSSKGLELWDQIWAAGEKYNIRAGCPNLIERLESGLLSFGNDMTYDTNPFECGLDRFFTLGKSAEYMSREALDKITSAGITKKMVNLRVDGQALPAARDNWPVTHNKTKVGKVTTLAFSPKFDATLAFAMVDIEHAIVGQQLDIVCDDILFSANVCTANWK